MLAWKVMAEAVITRAGPGDEADLADLGARSFSETFAHLYSLEDLQLFLAKAHSVAAYEQILSDAGSAVWIARTPRGEAVGYAVAGPCSLPVDDMAANAGELGRLYVLKSHQGQGLGVKLLEKALGWLKRQYGPLYISVYSENHGAQRLYRRYGFDKIKEYKYMVGNHADREFLFGRQPGRE
ncbi:GNAT family N-acetyltransferase [Parvularcula lutaonensis]|uniref:GNAT family N-acetyltransferase n=1 Tax=Parvularcula lutaonensis TaxID=491923 RepID=A0ABV7M978_9PROT|nr:N-acetyltransferase [Parvularcula lutaonensis]GGY46674.1 N-acetyltransferase [Parvularcula lutaonensis]